MTEKLRYLWWFTIAGLWYDLKLCHAWQKNYVISGDLPSQVYDTTLSFVTRDRKTTLSLVIYHRRFMIRPKVLSRVTEKLRYLWWFTIAGLWYDLKFCHAWQENKAISQLMFTPVPEISLGILMVCGAKSCPNFIRHRIISEVLLVTIWRNKRISVMTFWLFKHNDCYVIILKFCYRNGGDSKLFHISYHADCSLSSKVCVFIPEMVSMI